jgi:diketogulonate reductase-like aldo/keto reductase
VTRGDLWITSKARARQRARSACSAARLSKAEAPAPPRPQVANPSIAARRVEAACRDSLRRLGVAQLDLYLVHSPFTGVPLADTWREMEALVDAGLVRYIGVSNFRAEDLRALLPAARIRPVVNQLEARRDARPAPWRSAGNELQLPCHADSRARFRASAALQYHPYLQQRELAALCAAEGIALAAYCPLGPLTLWPGGPVDAAAAEVAAKHAAQPGATPAGVLLAWPIAQGHAVVRRSRREGAAGGQALMRQRGRALTRCAAPR